MDHAPEQFSSTFHNEGSSSYWAFLTRPEMLIRMDTATYLSRPAIEPLSPFLVKEFGGAVTADRHKQMLGHMVRQIMVQRGYMLDQSNVKISNPENIFSRATRYTLTRREDEPNRASTASTR